MQRIREIFDITTKREKTRGTLTYAIKARRMVEFYYHGGYRTAEPFALGIVMYGEADNESLICYQTEGFSDLRETVGWKLYRASEMEEITVLHEQFTGDRPGYDPLDIDMVKVFCCVIPAKAAVKPAAETPGLPDLEPRPVVNIVEKPTPRYLTHNELMRRFRFTHPQPIPDLSAGILSGAAIKPLPEHPELKNRHFKGQFRESIPGRANSLKFTITSAA